MSDRGAKVVGVDRLIHQVEKREKKRGSGDLRVGEMVVRTVALSVESRLSVIHLAVLMALMKVELKVFLMAAYLAEA